MRPPSTTNATNVACASRTRSASAWYGISDRAISCAQRRVSKARVEGASARVAAAFRESQNLEEGSSVTDCEAHRTDPQTSTVVDDGNGGEPSEAEADAGRSRL